MCSIHRAKRFWSSLLPLLLTVFLVNTGLAGEVVAESATAPTTSGSSICGSKFNDVNGNGVQDAGETGLQGWTFELLDAAGNVVGTTVSGPADAAGRVGTFCFSNVPAGGYTVREVAQPGWVQTVPSAPGTYSLTVGAGSAPRTLLFGNMLSPGSSTSVGSTICGTKFEDKNGNGRQDEGEAGLGGWTIQLTDERGNVLATVVTRKDGTYCFTGLPSGTYTLAEVMQPGWEQTFPGSPGTQTITVDGSHGKEGVNFGNRKPPGAGSVCGTKFEDKNGNGKQDEGEPGLGGWTIQITDEKGNVVGSVVTNKDGTFCFKDLHLGLFTVSEVMQPGWQQTLPGGTDTYSVQLTVEQSESKPLLFGNVQTAGTICGTKFEDKNGNGGQDPGELGLDGWTIQLTDERGNVLATVVTRKDGTYCFTGLPSGTYTLAEVMQPGWEQTFPGSPGTQTITVDGSHGKEGVNFGNRKPPGAGSVCGTKFEDKNGNGKQDEGEPGLGGWTIQITDEKGNVVGTVVTNKDGTFCFKDLHLGLFTLSEVMQPGWQQTLPGGTGTYSVQLTAEQSESKPLLFGNVQTAGTVCGIKYEDKNGNGKQDPGELGLDGWTIQAVNAAGQLVATVVTRKDGTYCFTGLRPGVYTFGEVMQPGWQQTFPGSPGTQTVTVLGGQNPQSIDFGNQKKPDTCCLSFTFQQGRTDNFATANGAEPAQPSAALIQALPASASYTSFDGTASDKFLAHTFTLPAGNCVESATLEFKAKPLEGMSDNDTVSLRFAGAPGTPTWGSYLGAGNSSPGLLSNAWTLLNYSTGQVFSLDLGSLPGGISLIPTLNAQRFLDFVVQDDTSVDYVRLTVKFCECAGSGATGPKSASDALALQPSVRAGVSVRLALDSTDAKVNGEAVRLSTPAVLRNGSTMVPLRWIGDALGAEVQWDQTERRATYLLGDLKVELWVDKVTARVNGKDATLSSAPTLIDGSTFVPLRFLGEAFGLTVKFNPDDQSINIFDQQP